MNEHLGVVNNPYKGKNDVEKMIKGKVNEIFEFMLFIKKLCDHAT